MPDNTVGKLFLGGLSPTTSTDMIWKHFKKYGKVVDAVAMYHGDKHRGFGFVTFDNQATADRVAAEPQLIDGREIQAKCCLAKGVAPPSVNAAAAAEKEEKAKSQPKIFVANMTFETTTEMLQEHFGKFGNVVDAIAMVGPDGKSRGFGFVTYDDFATAKTVLNTPQHLDGRKLVLKAAVREDKEVGWGSAGSGTNYGKGGKYGKDGFTSTQMAQMMEMMWYMGPPPMMMWKGGKGYGKGKWGPY
eukprot:gnl/TRDRNA2_/TRDRNA2_35139_c0_seq1.p1 gnl/TRDRNA2_/TRDRNA2_35139_c0~~gnl/TRDRNA2_/TRDRNA2_35139_c0_seq1.p1  ORF type:complete len:245 (+),score=64.96 gnl/TRDRNA2_/TRDRNA2_35139_c0_seq1:69-803(+)